jgi:hypothetical protein
MSRSLSIDMNVACKLATLLQIYSLWVHPSEIHVQSNGKMPRGGKCPLCIMPLLSLSLSTYILKHWASSWVEKRAAAPDESIDGICTISSTPARASYTHWRGYIQTPPHRPVGIVYPRHRHLSSLDTLLRKRGINNWAGKSYVVPDVSPLPACYRVYCISRSPNCQFLM